MDQWSELCAAVEPHRRRVLDHPVYKKLDDVAALRVFMEHHVWAVWDFMSLLTALQQRVTCTTVPWVPAGEASAARFVNEIKLGEECDTIDGGYRSHFDLYLDAMREVGAHTGTVEATVECVRCVPTARPWIVMRGMQGPEGSARFIERTLSIATAGSLPEVAAAFALGREQLIPDLFRPLLDVHGWPTFRLYLERHVELDEGEHGPLAHRLVREVCGDDADAWRSAETAAIASVAARHRLWDDTLHAIEGVGV